MNKTYIRTRDIFNIKDKSIRKRYFDYCYNKALKCGLICQVHINEKHLPVLYLEGSKCHFIKYYFVTMFATANRMDGVKRLISIVKT